MYNRLIQRGINFIFTYGNAGEENREIYAYGLELTLMYIINAGALLILGLIFGRFFETLLLLLAFALQQSFAGGYHAMTHLRCFLFMLAGWATAMLSLSFVQSYRYLPCALAVPGLLCVFLFAPVQHVNFPMGEEKEKRMKRIARFISVIFSAFVFVGSMLPDRGGMVFSILGITLFLSAVSITSAVIKEKLQHG